jgi:hypothetical protein
MRERERSKVEHLGDLQRSLPAVVFNSFRFQKIFQSGAMVTVL